MFIFWLLVLAIGGALTLYAMRAPAIRARIQYWGLSRELLLLINNVVLVLALAVVLLYTLYPLAYEAATGGEKASYGPPYYNRMFVPLTLVLAAFLCLAPVARWRRTPMALFRNTGMMFAAAVALGVLLPLAIGGAVRIGAMFAVGLGLWIAMTHAADVARKRRALTRGYLGMVFAHVGFAVALVGVGVTTAFSHELDVRVNVGESVELNDVIYEFNGVEQVQGPNYSAERLEFVTSTGAMLHPEKRLYPARNQVMTEAGIAPGLLRDLYITPGERLPDGSWGVRINDKPFVRWVWLGALLMALGGVLAITDRRYRRLADRDTVAEPSGRGDGRRPQPATA